MKTAFTSIFLFMMMMVLVPGNALAQWDPATATCEVGAARTSATLTIPGTGTKYKMLPPDNPTNPRPCLEGKDAGGKIVALGPMASAVCLVQAVLSQAMFAVYCDILNGMLPIFNILMALYLIFYVFCYIFGIADVNGKDFVIRLVKVMAIYAFATNPDVFIRYFYLPWFAMIDGIAEQISSLLHYANPLKAVEYEAEIKKLRDVFGSTGTGGSGHLPFFYRLDRLFADMVGKDAAPGMVLLAIMFLFSGAGFWVGLLIMCGVLSMLIAMVMVIVTYTTAMIALTFLLMFTPIFFALALFKTTQKIFEGWMASLISYTMQPILLYIMILILSGALSAGQDGLQALLVPTNPAACDATKEQRDDICNYRPLDDTACALQEEIVREECAPAVFAFETETKFNLGMAEAVIKNIPKIVDGKAGSIAPGTNPSRPDDIIFTPAAGASYDPNTYAMTGDPGEDPTIFNFIKDKAIPNILAFLIIGAMVSQFMTFVPRLGHFLSVWKGHRGTPVIAAGMGLSGKSNLFGSGNSGGSGVFGVGNWVTMGAGRALSAMAGYKGDAKVGAAGLGAAALAAREMFAKRDSSSNLARIAQGFTNRSGDEQNHLWYGSIAALTGKTIEYSKRGGESNQTSIATGDKERDNHYGFNFAGKYGYTSRSANPEQSAQYAMRIHGKKTVKRSNPWKWILWGK